MADENGTSEAPVEALYKALLEFAQEMLSEVGRFHPFGASVDHGGQMTFAPFRRDGQVPPPEEMVRILTARFREQAAAGEIQACGLCMDVLILPPGEEERRDAICLQMEEEDGEAVDIFVAYRKTTSGVQYDPPFPRHRSPEIFLPRERVN